jgi:NodT family efflux transporter outer membrane factor (OMF) lipoprotein
MPVQVPQSWSATGAAPLLNDWWRDFDDASLDALIAQALAENFTMQTAWDRLAQAEATAKRTGASLWPQVSADAGYRRSRQIVQDDAVYSDLYAAGVAASYEVDLWSRLRSTREAARLDAQASRDVVDAAAITLAASIANIWYQLAEAKALVRIAGDQIETNRKVLDIVTIQFRNGAASAADVLRQRQLVSATQSQLISAQETVELLQYTLSVLIGRPPELAWHNTAVTLPELSPMPRIGIPSEVLWHRPDVRQAYHQVRAADQRLAAAIADQYPQLSLSASADTTGTSVSDLFDDWLGNLAANAVQPLIDGGFRRAEVQRQRAVVSERIHAWGQTLLDALEEVETALTQQRQQLLLLGSLQQQLELARQTYDRNRERFMKGQAEYIRVLESLQSLQSLERDVIRARRVLIQRRIDLYRSTAGPWDLPRPELARTGDFVRSDTGDQNRIEDN